MNLDRLKKDELIDLITAYDTYIATAASAGRLNTGWVPVCISEFYSCEYQDVWRAGETFDYMFDYEAHESLFDDDTLVTCNDVRVFTENGQLMCQFDGEDEKRFIRSKIQDIKDGDAFFIGTGLHFADGDAHINRDEPDEPWIVYDTAGDSWFQEDICEPHVCIGTILINNAAKKEQKPALDTMIQKAENVASTIHKTAVEHSFDR